jgi:hypothetical protein
MADTISITVNTVATAILPGTLVYEASPVYHFEPNQPIVIKAYKYAGSAEVDASQLGAITTSVMGTAANTILIAGFDTVQEATIDVQLRGRGIQTALLVWEGTKTVA